MKYIGRIFAAILAFVMWSSSAQADRLSDAYDHLLNASFELPSIAAGALLDDIGLIVNGVLEEKKLSGENVDLEKSILDQLEEEKTLMDVAELTAELQRATTLGELQEVLIQFFGTKAGERLLELLIESEYLTAVDGVYRLADWAMAAYEGLDAVSVNSSNMILEEAEIINDNLNEIYARIESVAKHDIASNGFTEPKGREAQLKYITDRYYADARQVYEKIENELRQNWWNLFRNPKEKVALERMRDAFKAYLEENPSYYDYYAAYIRNLKRNPKNLEIQEMTGRYEEADSMLYVQVHVVSEIQWIIYRFEIRLQDTLVYEETRINDGQLSYRYDQPGQYTINVTAEDRWGQKKQRRLMMDVPGSRAGDPSDEETVPDEVGGGVQLSPVDTSVDPLRDTVSGGNTKGQEWETVEMICGNVSAYCIGGMWGILLKDGTIASEPIYTCVGLCNCGQGARNYGFEETIFAIRENQWYILSPKTGLEAGSHGAHGGATGLPMWNADSGMYSNAYGGHQYDGGMSAAYDENSLRGGGCTFSLMNCDGKAVISGASKISVPTSGRSTMYAYCEDSTKCVAVVKDGDACLINQNGDMLRVGTDAKWFYDDIVPIRADDGWTYYSAYGERLTATGYEDATSVWRDSERYYGWVRENGSWHTISLSNPGGYLLVAPLAAPEMNTAAEGTIRSFDWNRGTWSDTARYGLLEAVFCYRDSDRIPGGVAITGVIINPDSVEEYCIQSLAFPNTVDGKPVVGIETGCCENMLEFGEVAWPENLRYIGNRAFAGCAHLEDASLPVSVMDIGEYAFMDCDLWEGVALYEQAKIGLGAFAGTSNASPDGYIFLMDSEGRTTPSYFGEHCPQAIIEER